MRKLKQSWEADLKIGIIGAGTVGMTLAEHFSRSGHTVSITNSGEIGRLAERLEKLDLAVQPSTLEGLLDDAEILILAVPWRNVCNVLRDGIEWRDRVLVDATNIILSVDPSFEVDDLKGDSGSELVARLAPGARVVKAFNTLPFERMFDPAAIGFRRVLFVAADEAAAASTVVDLIQGIGFEAVAIGELATAGRQMEIGGPFSQLELYAAEDRGRTF